MVRKILSYNRVSHFTTWAFQHLPPKDIHHVLLKMGRGGQVSSKLNWDSEALSVSHSFPSKGLGNFGQSTQPFRASLCPVSGNTVRHDVMKLLVMQKLCDFLMTSTEESGSRSSFLTPKYYFCNFSQRI